MSWYLSMLIYRYRLIIVLVMNLNYQPVHNWDILFSRVCALGSSAEQQPGRGQKLHTVVSRQRHLQCHQHHLSDSVK